MSSQKNNYSGSIKPWVAIKEETLLSCSIFAVKRIEAISPSSRKKGSFFIIDNPDWVNIIPITKDNKVVMVRQFRFGKQDISLEIPGGIIDPFEKPMEAALRELKEETGFNGKEIKFLGSTQPNPATHNNRCHSFLLYGAEKFGEKDLDEFEEIEVELLALNAIPSLITQGLIDHSLVLNAFLFYQFDQIRLGNSQPWEKVRFSSG